MALLKKQKQQISTRRAAVPLSISAPLLTFGKPTTDFFMLRPLDTFVQHSWTFLNDG